MNTLLIVALLISPTIGSRRSVAVLLSLPLSLLAGSIIFFVAEKQANLPLRLDYFVVRFN